MNYFNAQDFSFPLGKRTYVMGVLNVTPDSFSDGGKAFGVEAGLVHAAKLLVDGADILDIGGESTRPGARLVPVVEEIERVVPLIARLKQTEGGEIWICGGASVANQFIRRGLIDRYHISVIPTIRGGGIRLFEAYDAARELKLIKTESYNGIVDLVYAPR